MSTPFHIPRILQQHCGGKSELRLRGTTVCDLLEDLSHEYPKLYQCICDESGAVRPHLNIFINNDLVRKVDGLDARIESGDVVSVFQAVSGG